MTERTAALIDIWTTHARSLRLWVLEFVAWMATVTHWRGLRLRVRAELRYLRSELRFLLAARVVIELNAGRLKPKARGYSRNNPVFDRALPQRRFLRQILRGVRLRSFADARRVFDTLDACVARCARNLHEGVAERGLVIIRANSRFDPACIPARIEAPDT